jgi:HNH endonuclease
MRPLDKGPTPQINGIPKTVARFQHWKEGLIDAIGPYCCYCNMPLTNSPQAEHVIPKNPRVGDPDGALNDWENLLLACGACNRHKSNKSVSADLYYLPEVHNTHLVFEYVEVTHPTKAGLRGCIPIPSAHPMVLPSKAKASIDLCEMGAIKPTDPGATDQRWELRYNALVAARQWRQDWPMIHNAIEDQLTELLLTAAKATGFFSIWYKVFQDIPGVCKALLRAFPGTAKDCFDPEGHPIPRNGNEI